MTDGTKKSTYNPVAQKKIWSKKKKIACTVFNEKYDIIKNIPKKMDLQVLTVMFWVWLIMI